MKPIGVYHTGGVRASQTVLGLNGLPLGFLQPDGRVLSPVDGALAGLLTPSGKVLNPAGHFVGALPEQPYRGYECGEDGTVRDLDGNILAKVDSSGELLPCGLESKLSVRRALGPSAPRVRSLIIVMKAFRFVSNRICLLDITCWHQNDFWPILRPFCTAGL
jgi:hypothetical protein